MCFHEIPQACCCVEASVKGAKGGQGPLKAVGGRFVDQQGVHWDEGG